jgi:nucleotide-binding universal stress UspA family protein
MKVLVGVDGSSNSFAAVRFVGRILSPERDELVLLYATPEASYLSEEQLDESVLVRARDTLSRAVYEEAVSRLPPAWQANITPPAPVGDNGPPSATLLEAIHQHRADMIAVGFRGTSLFERYVLGSVSRAIVYSAPIPVLVVKSEPASDRRAEQPAGAAQSPFQALAAYDGPPVGERLAAVAKLISWPVGTVGTVMTVVRPMHLTELPDWLQPATRDPDVAAMAEAWRKEHEQSVQAARDELKRFQQQLPACFRAREPIVAEGRAADKLLEKLHQEPFDLVMMGSRGSGPVSELLVGSTSAQVLSKGPCSVLIVR